MSVSDIRNLHIISEQSGKVMVYSFTLICHMLYSEWKDTAEHWYKSVQDVTAAAKAGMEALYMYTLLDISLFACINL